MTATEIIILIASVVVYLAMFGFTATLILSGDVEPAGALLGGFCWPVVLPVLLGAELGERFTKQKDQP